MSISEERKKGDCLYSEIFEIHEPDGRTTKWRTMLYPKGERRAQDGDMSLYVESLNSFDMKIGYVVSILDETGTKQNSLTVKEYLFNGYNYGWIAYCKEKTIQDHPQWLTNGNLTLVCEITLQSERTTSSEAEDPLSKRIHRQLCDDMSNLFLDETTSDVEIICGITSFPCHRGILSARSPVFKAMLQADMEEKRKGIVDIKDFSPDVIEVMLNYMYTSTVSSNAQQTAEVLKAAEQYQLDLLKNACEVSLCRELKINNCLTYLILGDMYQAEMLKNCSMKMLFENMNEVFTQSPEDWTRCVKGHPDLTVEITTEMARRQCQSVSPNDTS